MARRVLRGGRWVLQPRPEPPPPPYVPLQRPKLFVLEVEPGATEYTLKKESLSLGNAKKLSAILQENPQLTKLSLHEVGPNLSVVIQGSVFITHLDLSDTDLSSTKPTPTINALLGLKNTLISLTLNQTSISPQSVASFLSKNSSLQTLSLEANRLDNFGLSTILFRGANTCSSLETLILSKNDISSSGISDLADFLESNTTLKNLTLQDCRRKTTETDRRGVARTFIIGNELHGPSIGRLLQSPCLISLDISHNSKIREITAIGEALEENPPLQHFYLRNPDEAFLPFIPSVVHHNTNLRTFCVPSTSPYIGEERWLENELLESIAVNFRLTNIEYPQNWLKPKATDRLTCPPPQKLLNRLDFNRDFVPIIIRFILLKTDEGSIWYDVPIDIIREIVDMLYEVGEGDLDLESATDVQ